MGTRRNWSALPIVALLLALVGPVAAGERHDEAVCRAIWYVERGSSVDSYGALLRDNYRFASLKVRTDALRRIVAQFRKPTLTERHLEWLAWTLAGCGKRGFEATDKCWRISARRPSSRRAIVRGWATSRSPSGMKRILNHGVWDKNVSVAERAITGLGHYTHLKDSWRRTMIEKLILRYSRLTSGIAGKKKGAPEYKAYSVLSGPIRETLAKLTAGQEFDTAAAWAAWFKKNRNKLPPISKGA